MSDPERLGERYPRIRGTTVSLAAPLTPEDQLVQSMPDASPTKWHLAHTTWFFESFVLSRHVDRYQPVDETYSYLFNSYYEGVGPRQPRPQRGAITRPSLAEVHRYRRRVDEAMAGFLGGGTDPDAAAVVELGLQHEQQHQELILTDIHHALWSNPLRPAYRPQAKPASAPGSALAGWIKHPGGLVDIGHDGRGFAFDNERPRHRVYLEPFDIAGRPVTTAEFLSFIEDGGYQRPQLWLSDGWAAVQAQAWEAPLYWERGEDDGWREFTLAGFGPLERDAPVSHVSFYEADAYARWAGARLPTETEWETVAAASPLEGNFSDSGALVPRPAAGGSGGPLAHLFGDVWEWTASAYLPYPRFRPLEGALGEYNGKFMCNQMVLRGGSCFTPRAHIRATYRNFFPPAARWQMSGFRLARWE